MPGTSFLSVRSFAAALIGCMVCVTAYSQKVYFADGYHGGIYGHYPVEWKTKFITDQYRLYPGWRINLEIEPETWDTVLVRTPGAYREFKRIAASERIEFTNPAYGQPYCYNISGESIIRHFGYGIKKIHRHFPEVVFTTYSAEEPCFTSALPQLLKQFGFKYAVLKCPNTCWGGYMAPYGGELVNWTGPDGSCILTVPRYACEDLAENSVWQTTAWANSKPYLDACFRAGIVHPVGMCFQDAGWKKGPWLGAGETVKNASAYVTWKEYIEQVTSGRTDDNYRMSQEDVRVSLMWGSQILQRIARQVRHSENRIAVAEKNAFMAAAVNGFRYSEDAMDEAWRNLMLAQHHDCWIVPYNKLPDGATWARHVEKWTSTADSISRGIIANAHASFNTPESEDSFLIRVYNTIGERRTEPVSIALPGELRGSEIELYDASGQRTACCTETVGRNSELIFTADVPSFGYTTYMLKKCGKAADANVKTPKPRGGEYILENDVYRITLDSRRGGVITGLIAKKQGDREYASADSPYSIGELRGYFYDEKRFHSSADAPARITVLKDNAFEKSVRINGLIASHPFVQTITIRKGQPRIDFRLTVDWQGNPGIGEYRQKDTYRNNRRAFYDDRFKLNVLFPVALDSAALYKDAPFDVCRSTLGETHFNMWDSIKHTVILHWVDVSGADGKEGFALLSDHTTSYSHGGNFPLALTAQYSGGGLWGRNYAISGPLVMNFAVMPHRGTWEEGGVPKESLAWNEPLMCSLHSGETPERRSLVDLNGSGYEISAAYVSDERLVLRLFNATGDASVRKVRLGFPLAKVLETDLQGNAVDLKMVTPTEGGFEMEVAMPRFGIKTFLITR